MTGYAADEEERLQLLIQDKDFVHVINRRGQIAIAATYCEYLWVADG
jgi:hypothetical protein